MTFVFQGVTYKTKAAVVAVVRAIVAKYPVGAYLPPPDRDVIVDLLAHHPRCAEKVGLGVRDIKIGLTPYSQKALAIVRVDGTSTDFSWVKCINGDDHKKSACSAMRRSVEDQTRAFKQEALKGALVCPFENVVLTLQNSHVDHYLPPFDVLVDVFLANENITIDDVALTSSKDNQMGRLLADDDLKKRWCAFHRDFARLRLISAKANLSMCKKMSSRT